ncbi:hypothetical protein HH310_23400 [Actinoplanes sp. TBRC 11911]|uniref:hypothetical protein n=1 Tax=Actinoplanes sp. TBRC 11911 TaxID=2729386 RepID=UPI00145D2289|nr:hypothetical protein [Actinoplanes sp. TBRC 11911]NMO54117.1 hypothetical protein [Actinoplanes sp. TBRC 11911]
MIRMVIRPRVQVAVLLVCFGGFFLIGVAMFGDGEILAEREWFGIAIACMTVVLGGAGIWRTLRLGVVIASDGLRVRSLDSRDQFTAWSEVESIECQQVDERAGLPIYAPVIRLPEFVMPVMALGTYSRKDAERKTELLRSMRAADPAMQ